MYRTRVATNLRRCVYVAQQIDTTWRFRCEATTYLWQHFILPCTEQFIIAHSIIMYGPYLYSCNDTSRNIYLTYFLIQPNDFFFSALSLFMHFSSSRSHPHCLYFRINLYFPLLHVFASIKSISSLWNIINAHYFNFYYSNFIFLVFLYFNCWNANNTFPSDFNVFYQLWKILYLSFY